MNRPTNAVGHPLPDVAAVLFDLDGTLLDTAGDIALALNRTITGLGVEALPVERVRDMVGRGSAMLIRRALEARGHVADEATHGHLLETFLAHYEAIHDADESVATPYPGAAEALARLEARGLPLAVVTNKQQAIAERTLEGVGLLRHFRFVIGGDTCTRRKPDPDQLLYACERLAIPAARALMVGDSLNDVRAARSAGIRVYVVPYGYNEGQDPRNLDCDGFLDSLDELPALIATGPAG